MTTEIGTRPLRGRSVRASLQGTAPRVALHRVAKRVAASHWQEVVLLGIAVWAILTMRDSLVGWASQDYNQFLSPWFGFLQENGFHGLGKEFADYNVPYLYLLWIGTLTPATGLSWVKFLSSASDLALAAGSFALLRQLRLPRFTAAGAAILLLLLPEVLLNSAVWGQADSLYTALIVWSLCFVLRQRPTAAWVLYALALSFKLQALFVLPALALAFVVLHHRVRSLLVAVAVFLLTYVPAIVAGRSIPSLLDIYAHQADQYHQLTMNAASLYVWLPQASFDTFQRTGTLFALAVVAVLAAVLLRRFRTVQLTGETLLLVAAFFAVLMPFILPAMHERYFYTGGVLVLLLAVVRRRFVVVALACQVVAVQSYTPALFGTEPFVPFPVLVLVQLGVILALLWPLLVAPAKHPALEPAAVLADGQSPITHPHDRSPIGGPGEPSAVVHSGAQ